MLAVESRFSRGAPGSAGILPARDGGPQWTTRRKPATVPAGKMPALPGTAPQASPVQGAASRDLHRGRLNLLWPGIRNKGELI